MSHESEEKALPASEPFQDEAYQEPEATQRDQNYGLTKFLGYVFGRFKSDSMFQRGAVLSLLLLFFLLASGIVFSGIFTSLSAFESLRTQAQNLIFAHFVPETANTIQSFLNVFTESHMVIIMLGGLAFLTLAVLLLLNISNAFSAIWQVQQKRTLITRVAAQWTFTTGAAGVFTLQIMANRYLDSLQSLPYTETYAPLLVHLASWLVPFLLELLIIVVLYTVIPLFPVRRRDAFVGALIATVLFEILKFLLHSYLSLAPLGSNAYNVLAFLPVALLAVYGTWLAVLLGAELTAALPEWRSSIHDASDGRDLPLIHKMEAVLSTLHVLLKATSEGKGRSAGEILDETGLTPVSLVYATRELERLYFVARDDHGRWVLTRELSHISLFDLYKQLRLGLFPEESRKIQYAQWTQLFHQLAVRTQDASREIMALDLKDMLLAMDTQESA